MDISVNAAVNSALQLQQVQVEQEKQNLLLKQAIQGEAAAVQQLLEGVAPAPQLASEGSLGTKINTYA